MDGSKKCNQCNEEIPLSGFHRRTSKPNGYRDCYLTICKNCQEKNHLRILKKTQKLCNTCGKVKHPSLFGHDKRHKDLLNRKCKDCIKAESQKRHQKKSSTAKLAKKKWDSMFCGIIEEDNIPTKEHLLKLLITKNRKIDKVFVKKELEEKTEDFVKQANEVWGIGTFDYSSTVFYSRGVVVIHKEFGPTWQRPDCHLKGIFPFGTKAFSRNKEIKIIKDYLAGKSSIELGLEYNVADNTITGILKRNNINIRGPEKLNKDDKNQILQRWEEGKYVSEISEEFKISKQTVYKVLDRFGLKPDRDNPRYPKEQPKRRIIPPEIEDEIFTEYESTKKPYVAELSRKFGYANHLVEDVIKRKGGTPRKYQKISDEEFEEIRHRYANNEKTTDLAKEYGVNNSAIITRLHRIGDEVKLNQLSATPEDEMKIIELYNAGYGSHKISKALGFSKSLILTTLQKYDIDTSRTPDFYSRYSSEEEKKFIKSLRGRLEKIFKQGKKRIENQSFTKTTLKFIGCSSTELVTHLLETKPKRVKLENCHLDHIIPISAFANYIDNEDIIHISSHYQNLQLLSKRENMRKGDNVELGLKMLLGKKIKDRGIFDQLVEFAQRLIEKENEALANILEV